MGSPPKWASPMRGGPSGGHTMEGDGRPGHGAHLGPTHPLGRPKGQPPPMGPIRLAPCGVRPAPPSLGGGPHLGLPFRVRPI